MDFQTSMFFGSLAVGIITAVATLVYGLTKSQPVIAAAGAVACFTLALVGGFLLALPACIGFCLWAAQRHRKQRADASFSQHDQRSAKRGDLYSFGGDEEEKAPDDD